MEVNLDVKAAMDLIQGQQQEHSDEGEHGLTPCATSLS